MHIKTITHALIVAGSLGLGAFSAPALAADAAIAVVNGQAIPALHAKVLRDERVARGQSPQDVTDELLRELLVAVEIQAQEAQKKGLDKPEEIVALLELQRKESMVKLLQEDFIRTHSVPADQSRSEYEKLKARAGDTEYHVRHILVEDEKSAKDLISKLTGKKKAKFEDVAKESSKDSSAAKGGDLGWIAPGAIVPEFAQAMTNLKKGEITSKPVQTRMGWHIIKLEDTRKLEFPDYVKVKSRIEGEILQAAYRKYVEDLKAAAKVETP